GVRTDHALASGTEISPHYDSMIAKVIAHGRTRDEARERLAQALDDTVALGVATNKAFLAAVLRDEDFARGPTTDFISRRFAKIEPVTPDPETLAVAAVLLAESANFGEWNSWSNNAARVMRVRLAETDVSLRRANGAYAAQIGDSGIALRVISITPPHARIMLNGVERTVTFALGDRIHIAMDGRSYSLADTTHAPAQRASAASDGRLLAPMNGRVVAVHAKAGDTAEAGRALIVLEAMKMEHALSVPQAARIKAVHVTAGAQVAPGQLLAELESA
ncbi:MAG TPA: biotin/lipoyl-containing protein, partial [Xanthobacteraceae bacterium]|nr:biotin/lipoyl-containing protein [Xanthobacteraceae bacterium]